MKLTDAIKLLQKIEKQHGGDTPIFFDCPHCLHSFAPDKVVTSAVHLSGTYGDKAIITNTVPASRGFSGN